MKTIVFSIVLELFTTEKRYLKIFYRIYKIFICSIYISKLY